MSKVVMIHHWSLWYVWGTPRAYINGLLTSAGTSQCLWSLPPSATAAGRGGGAPPGPAASGDRIHSCATLPSRAKLKTNVRHKRRAPVFTAPLAGKGRKSTPDSGEGRYAVRQSVCLSVCLSVPVVPSATPKPASVTATVVLSSLPVIITFTVTFTVTVTTTVTVSVTAVTVTDPPPPAPTPCTRPLCPPPESERIEETPSGPLL